VKILIAEDSAIQSKLLETFLTKRGHDVITTTNGAEAFEVMQLPDAPSLAILDWMMPVMDGIEACRRIRSQDGDRPPYIIILTSRDERPHIIAGLEAGANDFLSKPFDPGELMARIDVGRRTIAQEDRLGLKIKELLLAGEKIKTLQGVVHICASCKQIRDDKGYWQQVEVYIRDHTHAQFSQSVCPECVAKLYPEFTPQKGLGCRDLCVEK